jgi:hypothetical protein
MHRGTDFMDALRAEGVARPYLAAWFRRVTSSPAGPGDAELLAAIEPARKLDVEKGIANLRGGSADKRTYLDAA